MNYSELNVMEISDHCYWLELYLLPSPFIVATGLKQTGLLGEILLCFANISKIAKSLPQYFFQDGSPVPKHP